MGNDGDSVVHLTDMFQSDTSDVEWISKLAAQRDWIIISGDLRITKSPHERKVWQQAKLTTFFLARGWTKLDFWEQAWRLVRWWPGIVELAGRVAPGAAFLVPPSPSRTKFKQLKLTD